MRNAAIAPIPHRAENSSGLPVNLGQDDELGRSRASGATEVCPDDLSSLIPSVVYTVRVNVVQKVDGLFGFPPRSSSEAIGLPGPAEKDHRPCVARVRSKAARGLNTQVEELFAGLGDTFALAKDAWAQCSLTKAVPVEHAAAICQGLNVAEQRFVNWAEDQSGTGTVHINVRQAVRQRLLNQIFGEQLQLQLRIVALDDGFFYRKIKGRSYLYPMESAENLWEKLLESQEKQSVLVREKQKLIEIVGSLRARVADLKGTIEAREAELEELKLELSLQETRAAMAGTTGRVSKRSQLLPEFADPDEIFAGIPEYEGGHGKNPFDFLAEHFGKWLKFYGAEEDTIFQDWIRARFPVLLKALRNKLAYAQRRDKSLRLYGEGRKATPAVALRKLNLSDIIPTRSARTDCQLEVLQENFEGQVGDLQRLVQASARRRPQQNSR